MDAAVYRAGMDGVLSLVGVLMTMRGGGYYEFAQGTDTMVSCEY